MSCPDCDGDLAVLVVLEPLESHAPEAALTVGLCVDCLRLHSTETPPSDDASRPLAGASPDGDAGTAVAFLVDMLNSLAFNCAGIVDCAEFVKRSGTGVHLTLDRPQQTAAAPRFDITCRQC